jgi:DegV family protein with EDD domain
MNTASIGIVTDSTADVPSALLQQYDIRVVPINIQFRRETYEENVALDRATFLRWLDEREMPTSSQPSPGRFTQAFQTLVEEGYEQLLCVAITSKHSGTYQSAVLASSMMPHVKIEVWDSLAISMGTGFQVLAAARMAETGASLEAILRRLEEIRSGMRTYLTPATLRYLQKSGRVGTLSGVLASLLAVKPIIHVEDGALEVGEKVRTRSKALKRMVELILRDLGQARSVRVAIAHAEALEEARSLGEQLEAMLNCIETHIVDLACSLTVHGGPGLVGVIAYGEEW